VTLVGCVEVVRGWSALLPVGSTPRRSSRWSGESWCSSASGP